MQDGQFKTTDLPVKTSDKYIISTKLTLAYWQLFVANKSAWGGPEGHLAEVLCCGLSNSMLPCK